MAHPAAFLGIDFGTAYSAMAWVDPTTGHADILCNAEGDVKTRSAVYFGRDEIHVGRLAEELLEHEEDSEFVLLGAKRDLTRNVPYSLPDGRTIRPMDVAVAILAKLKRDAEASHFHESVRKAVITVPAIFDPLERKKIEAAASQAGFETVELLDEPVAAAIAYLQSGQKVGKRVLVYDLGAGTFDAAILEHEENDIQPFRLAMPPEGLHFGGDDLDGLLWNHLIELANGGASTIRQDRSLSRRLLHRCRRLKEVLSDRDSHKLVFELPDGTRFQRAITRDECERVFKSRLEETVGIASHLFEKAAKSGGSPETLVLIGGSSRIPLISRLLSNSIPLTPRIWHRQDVAVALGAALYADVIWGHRRHRTYRDALKHAKRTGQIFAKKLIQLRTQLRLGDAEAVDIEKSELGGSVESLLAKSRLSDANKYQKIVAEMRTPITETIVRQLEQEASKLKLSPSDAAEIERQILGDSKEELLAREASKRHAVAEEFIVKAGVLQNAGNLDGALEQAQLACDRAPKSAASHYLKGSILLDLGKLELAESALEVALELDPSHHDARSRRGLCRLFLGNAPEACEDFDAVIPSHSPSSPDLYYLRAIARVRIGNPQGAASDLLKSLADEKSFESACNTPAVGGILSLGLVKLRLLQCPVDAMHCFSQVLKLFASNNVPPPSALLSSLCWIFGTELDSGHPRPSDVVIRLAYHAFHTDQKSENDIPRVAGYGCPRCGSFDNSAQVMAGKDVLQCRKCGQPFVNSLLNPTDDRGDQQSISFEMLRDSVQLSLWDSFLEANKNSQKQALREFHHASTALNLPIHCLTHLEDETLGVETVSTLAAAGDDEQAAQFVAWLISKFDLDICKLQADPQIISRPGLKELLTPGISVQENHGVFFNDMTVINHSLFSVHDVQAIAKVVREDGKALTITRTIARLGPGEQHQWTNVFPDGGFFGGNIKSVDASVNCRQGGSGPIG